VGPVDHSVRLRGGVGSTFSREQCIRPKLLGQRKKLPLMGLPAGSVRVVYVD
jgi:hypothetical protein